MSVRSPRFSGRLRAIGGSIPRLALILVLGPGPGCEDADADPPTAPTAAIPTESVATTVEPTIGKPASSLPSLPRPAPPAGIDPISRRAIGSVGQEIARTPDSTPTWVKYGSVCLMNLWGEEAILAYRHALTRPDANRPRVLWFLAHALWESERFEEAIEAAQESLRLGPGFSEGWVTVATWQLDLGELESAARSLERANAGTIDPLRRAVVAAELALQSGRNDEARAVVLDLVETAPGPLASRLAVDVGRAVGDANLVGANEELAAAKIGRFEDPRMVAIAPLGRHERADLRRAVRIRQQLPPEQALVQVRRIIVQRPRLPMLRVIAADCLRDLGRDREAKSALDSVYESNPSDHEYWALDAIVHLNLVRSMREDPGFDGETDEAVEAMMIRARSSSERAVRINPSIGYGWQFRALVLEADGRWSEAAEAFRRAAEVAETESQRAEWTTEAARCESAAVTP